MKSISETRSFKALRIIWYFFKPYKLKLAFVILVMVTSGLLEALNLAALYPVINYGLEQQSEGFLIKFFNILLPFLDNNNLFLASCYLLIIVAVIAVGTKAYNNYLSSKLMVSILGRYQKAILETYIKADYEFFIKHQQGKLLHTGTVASVQVSSMVMNAIRALNDFLILLFMFSLLTALIWQGSIIITVIGVLYFMLVKKVMSNLIYASGKHIAEADRSKNVILNEFITGIKTIKVFFEYESWRKKYHNAVDRSMHHQFRQLMGRILPESLMKLTFYLILAGIGIFINYAARGNIMLMMPIFGTFVIVASRLIPAAQTLGTSLMNLVNCLPNAKIVYELFHKETRAISEGDKILKEFNSKITFKDIYFKYKGMDDYLLEGLNFNIDKKKVTAIVGPSGNGKTTIINILLRLHSVNSGNIFIDGTDISKYTNESFLAKIGYVSQETFIYNATIKENILFGMTNCTDEMLLKAANQASAHEFILKTQDGYNTFVGDSGIKLSGGQRQRIAIARALLRQPEIMVLDEATSSLDNIAENKVQEAINKISKHTTVLMIAHRLSTIQNADKILVISGGKIVEEGRHEELLNNKNEYFRLYNMQLDGSS